MRGILEFDLPEDNEQFKVAQDAGRLSMIIERLDTYLRNRIEYDELTEEQYEVYQRVRIKLTELTNG